MELWDDNVFWDVKSVQPIFVLIEVFYFFFGVSFFFERKLPFSDRYQRNPSPKHKEIM
jgi:hypothetical protein